MAIPWPEYSLESPDILALTPAMTSNTSMTSNVLPEREKLWKEFLPQLAARAKDQCSKGEGVFQTLASVCPSEGHDVCHTRVSVPVKVKVCVTRIYLSQ